MSWDMGCGAAATSLFLALEYDVEVWAADPWIDPTDNLARVRDAGLDRRVYPLRVDADALLFADGWFDALFSVDAYHYFGMRDHFLASYGHDNPDLASRSPAVSSNVAPPAANSVNRGALTRRAPSGRCGSRTES